MDGFRELTHDGLKTAEGVAELNRMLSLIFEHISSDGQRQRIYQGSGTPEAAVVADIGSLYMRLDGGAVTSLYVKESGTGATGWVAK